MTHYHQPFPLLHDNTHENGQFLPRTILFPLLCFSTSGDVALRFWLAKGASNARKTMGKQNLGSLAPARVPRDSPGQKGSLDPDS